MKAETRAKSYLADLKAGMSLAAVGRHAGVSRQRIQQILGHRATRAEYRKIMSERKPRGQSVERIRVCKGCGQKFLRSKIEPNSLKTAYSRDTARPCRVDGEDYCPRCYVGASRTYLNTRQKVYYAQNKERCATYYRDGRRGGSG